MLLSPRPPPAPRPPAKKRKNQKNSFNPKALAALIGPRSAKPGFDHSLGGLGGCSLRHTYSSLSDMASDRQCVFASKVFRAFQPDFCEGRRLAQCCLATDALGPGTAFRESSNPKPS